MSDGAKLLEIDGVKSGVLQSVAGGSGFADVMAAWARQGQPSRNLTVITVDLATQNAIGRRDFPNAIITETTVPTMNTAAKDSGKLMLRIVPQSSRPTKMTGRVELPLSPWGWLVSSFRLDLPGLDCTKVRQIDSFTIVQPVGRPVGDPVAAPAPVGPVRFPNLTMTLPESAAATWQAWFDGSVASGKSDEKTGTLALLDATAQEFARIGLFNAGIFRLAPATWSAGAVAPPSVVARALLRAHGLHIRIVERANEMPGLGLSYPPVCASSTRPRRSACHALTRAAPHHDPQRDRVANRPGRTRPTPAPPPPHLDGAVPLALRRRGSRFPPDLSIGKGAATWQGLPGVVPPGR